MTVQTPENRSTPACTRARWLQVRTRFRGSHKETLRLSITISTGSPSEGVGVCVSPAPPGSFHIYAVDFSERLFFFFAFSSSSQIVLTRSLQQCTASTSERRKTSWLELLKKKHRRKCRSTPGSFKNNSKKNNNDKNNLYPPLILSFVVPSRTHCHQDKILIPWEFTVEKEENVCFS